jgi:hypothetical protein
MTTERSRAMAVLTVLAMLAVGVFIGVALDRGVLRQRTDPRFGRGGRGGGPFGFVNEPVDTAKRNQMRARIVKRFTEDLTLTPVQAHLVDSIFARRELQLDSLRSRVGPQLDSLRDQMRVSIDSVLTPEQRVKFAEQRKKFDARRKADDTDRRPPND